MKRYYIVYEGRVQGVGFRWRLAMLADMYNFTGWCRNLYNGNVECEIQGNGVDEFVKKSLVPDTYVRIDDYSIKELPVDEEEREFRVRF